MKASISKATYALLIAIFISANVFYSGGANVSVSLPTANGGPKRGYNTETGRLAFIGSDTPIHVPGASGVRNLPPQSKAMVALHA